MKDLLAGFDELKEGWFTCKLPEVGAREGYSKLQMLPATTGLHRYGGRMQAYYEAVHRFLAHRKWRAAEQEVQTAGVTWLELFAMFDSQGYRTAEDRVHSDQKAKARAEKRSAAKSHRRRTCLPRPSL